MLIAFTGHAGAGKDTAANYLVEKHGFETRSFAAKLKDLAIAANPIVSAPHGGIPRRLQDMIDLYGSLELAKRAEPEVRAFLQRLGTAGVREHFGTDFWVDQILPLHHGWGPEKGAPPWLPPKLAITDCRFPNEAARVRALGGYLVQIHRDDTGPANDHVSEQLPENPDVILINEPGNRARLFNKLDTLVQLIKEGSL